MEINVTNNKNPEKFTLNILQRHKILNTWWYSYLIGLTTLIILAFYFFKDYSERESVRNLKKRLYYDETKRYKLPYVWLLCEFLLTYANIYYFLWFPHTSSRTVTVLLYLILSEFCLTFYLSYDHDYMFQWSKLKG